jgi:thioredoxin 2
MAPTTIVTCPSCGKRNRVATAAQGVPRCGACHAPLPWIIDAEPAHFDEQTTASMPVLVDFWADWCAPCRMVSPALERLAREHAGRLKLVKLDVESAPEISSRFGAQSIPLLVLLRDGEEVDRRVGAAPEPELRRWLDRHLAATGDARPT